MKYIRPAFIFMGANALFHDYADARGRSSECNLTSGPQLLLGDAGERY